MTRLIQIKKFLRRNKEGADGAHHRNKEGR